MALGCAAAAYLPRRLGSGSGLLLIVGVGGDSPFNLEVQRTMGATPRRPPALWLSVQAN